MVSKVKHWVPELLSPAGSLDKLKVAINYGADAVYLGGLKFGLRAAAENFTRDQLKEGVDYAHERNSKVFVVINAFPFDQDLKDLPDFIKYLEEISIDALIVSDLGAVNLINKISHIPIHVSTQASVLNLDSAEFWKAHGACRVILGREVSIEEANLIKKSTELEVEQFIHGSMCMAYSGNCTISNFTQGRDSNRGGCSHSCRFKYELRSEENTHQDYFMSSKDLEGVDFLDEFISKKIDSLKIEGRMKGPIYTATVTKAYRRALDFYEENGFISDEEKKIAKDEVSKVTHREYFSGSLGQRAGDNSVFDEREHSDSLYNVLGSIISVDESFAYIHTKSKILKNKIIEVIPFSGEVISVELKKIELINGCEIQSTTPDQVIRIGVHPDMNTGNIVRFLK